MHVMTPNHSATCSICAACTVSWPSGTKSRNGNSSTVWLLYLAPPWWRPLQRHLVRSSSRVPP